MNYLYKLIKASGVTLSYDKRYVLLYYKKAILYNTENYTEVGNYIALNNTICADISYDNTKIVFKNTSGNISLWDITYGILLKIFSMNKSEGSNCLFTPDNKYIIDADWNGNISIIDICNLNFKVIKKYNNYTINGIDFDINKSEFIFTLVEKYTQDNINRDYNKYIILWKYPFENNMDVRYLLPREVDTFDVIKHIPNSEDYYSISKNKIIILNKFFRVKKSIAILLDYGFKQVRCSDDGKYIASIKHGINIYNLKTNEFIENYFIKGAKDIRFIDDNKHIIVASVNGSCVIKL